MVRLGGLALLGEVAIGLDSWSVSHASNVKGSSIWGRYLNAVLKAVELVSIVSI